MLSIETILKFYGLFCLTMLPFSLGTIIFLYRKTNIMERFEERIDRVLENKKTSKKQNPEKNKATDDKESENKPKEAAGEQQTELEEAAGVARFKISIGDFYYCKYVSGIGNSNQAVVWTPDNDFIGSVDDNAVFTAKKAGRVKISCSRADNDFDNGTLVYDIEVTPRNEKWFAEPFNRFILSGAKQEQVLPLLLGGKLSEDIPGKGIMSFDQPDMRITVQFNRSKIIERAVFTLKRNDQTIMRELEKEVEDRYEKVKLKKGDLSIWIHRDVNVEHDEVEAYAFITTNPEGCPILAIGRTWRENADIEEFLLNIGMAQRMFRDCIPNLQIEELKATIEKNNKPAQTPPKNDTIENAPEQSNGEKTGKTPTTEKESEEQGKEKDIKNRPENNPDEHQDTDKGEEAKKDDNPENNDDDLPATLDYKKSNDINDEPDYNEE